MLALAWLGYTAWPLYDIFVLLRAFETRNFETLRQNVYFDSVRRSLSDQIIVAYIQRSGIQLPPLARAVPGAALAIADPVVAKIVSPEALSEFLTSDGRWQWTLMCREVRSEFRAKRLATRGRSTPLPNMAWAGSMSLHRSRSRGRSASGSSSSCCNGAGG
jgi:hypothetical protein